MALQVGELFAKIGLKDEAFQQALKRVRASLAATAKAAGMLAKGAGWFALGAGLAQAATSALALAGELMPLAGLLGALPAVLGAAVAATATLKMGIGGLTEALKGKKDALEELTPAARAVYDEIKAQEDAWSAVKEAVETGIFTPVRGHITALAQSYLPILETRLGGIGEAWGRAFAQAAEVARSETVVSGVTQILDSTRVALDRIGESLGPLLRGIGASFGAGAPLVERFGDAIANVVTAFGAWLEASAESGKLVAWVEQGAAVLGQLWTVVSELGKLLGTVFSSAAQASGGLLGTLGQVLTVANQFLSSAEGTEVLATIFGTIRDTVGGITPALTPLLSAIGGIVTAVAPLLPVLGQLVGTLGTGVAGAVKALLPGLSAIATALADGLGPIIPMISAHFERMTPIMSKLGGTLGRIISSAVTVALKLFAALAPVLSQVAEVVATVLLEALDALLPLLTDMLPLWAELAADAMPALVPLVSELGRVLLELLPILPPLVGLLVAVLPPLMRLGVTVTKAVLPAITTLIGWLATLIGWIAKGVAWFLKLLTTTESWKAIGDFLSDLWSGIVSAVSTGISKIVSFVTGLRDRMAQHLNEAWSQAKNLFRAGINAVGTIMSELPKKVMSTVSSIPGRIKNAVGSFRSAAIDIGRQIINGMADGIKGAIGSAISAAKKAVGSIIQGAKDALIVRSPSKVAAREIGRWIPPGIAEGIMAGIPRLTRLVQQMMPQIMPEMGGPSMPVAPAAAPTPPPVVVRVREAGDVANFYGTSVTLADWERWQRRREIRARVGRAR